MRYVGPDFFNPNDWYWRVNGQVYSSIRNQYVAENDTGFTDWKALAPGHIDATDIASEAELAYYMDPIWSAAFPPVMRSADRR